MVDFEYILFELVGGAERQRNKSEMGLRRPVGIGCWPSVAEISSMRLRLPSESRSSKQVPWRVRLGGSEFWMAARWRQVDLLMPTSRRSPPKPLSVEFSCYCLFLVFMCNSMSLPSVEVQLIAVSSTWRVQRLGH